MKDIVIKFDSIPSCSYYHRDTITVEVLVDNEVKLKSTCYEPLKFMEIFNLMYKIGKLVAEVKVINKTSERHK